MQKGLKTRAEQILQELGYTVVKTSKGKYGDEVRKDNKLAFYLVGDIELINVGPGVRFSYERNVLHRTDLVLTLRERHLDGSGADVFDSEMRERGISVDLPESRLTKEHVKQVADFFGSVDVVEQIEDTLRPTYEKLLRTLVERELRI